MLNPFYRKDGFHYEEQRCAYLEGLRLTKRPPRNFLEEQHFMQIKYRNIILRDMEERDIADDIRWNTIETEWALWDAPWELEELRRFDPAAYREKELAWIARSKPEHRLGLEIDTAEGVHIGSVSTYALDGDLNWRECSSEENRRAVSWAVGIDINDPAYWSSGWGTKALTAWVRYHLAGGYTNLYTQTWSGNFRMIRLAEKLGFRECRRKTGVREVRGGRYDALTFRLDRDAFEAHWKTSRLELYIPRVEDMWFTQRMQEDPDTMSYNAGWDVSFPGYHPDTGCIDFPESRWAAKHSHLVGHEPNFFYAFLREAESGSFVGEVNFHPGPEQNWHELGVVLYAPYRGQGYGHAALELLLRRAFLHCGVKALHNSFEPTRDPGLAIHRRAGFRQVGTSSTVRFGEPLEVLELELTREDYLKRMGLRP